MKWPEDHVQRFLGEYRHGKFSSEQENFRGLTGVDLVQFTEEQFLRRASASTIKVGRDEIPIGKELFLAIQSVKTPFGKLHSFS